MAHRGASAMASMGPRGGGVHLDGPSWRLGHGLDGPSWWRQVIGECAHWVLADESTRAVAADLHARGLTSVAANPKTVTALKKVLLPARISERG